VVLAGLDLLRVAGHLPGSKRPKGWRPAAVGFGRRTEDKKYTLRVWKRGHYWCAARRTGFDFGDYEYLAFAFQEGPLFTRTEQEAMRIADYYHRDLRHAVPGCWRRYSPAKADELLLPWARSIRDGDIIRPYPAPAERDGLSRDIVQALIPRRR
jgi:hypothetical protein